MKLINLDSHKGRLSAIHKNDHFSGGYQGPLCRCAGNLLSVTEQEGITAIAIKGFLGFLMISVCVRGNHSGFDR